MTRQLPAVEGLESRSLFSVMPVAAGPTYLGVGDADQPKALVAKPAVSKAAAAKQVRPSLVGRWDGRFTVKRFPFKFRYDLDLKFHSISKDTKIAHGTLEIGRDEYSGRWTGIMLGKTGQFKYTLRLHGDKITIEGTVDPKSKFAWGRVTIDWDFGGRDRGDFSMSRWG